MLICSLPGGRPTTNIVNLFGLGASDDIVLFADVGGVGRMGKDHLVRRLISSVLAVAPWRRPLPGHNIVNLFVSVLAVEYC